MRTYHTLSQYSYEKSVSALYRTYAVTNFRSSTFWSGLLHKFCLQQQFFLNKILTW